MQYMDNGVLAAGVVAGAAAAVGQCVDRSWYGGCELVNNTAKKHLCLLLLLHHELLLLLDKL